MKVYNTLTRKLETIKEKKLKMFVCGVTVYDYAHIGHARSYVCFDVIAKFFRFKKIKVYYLQNITDIDDKVINKSKESGEQWDVIAKRFTEAYVEDMKILGVSSVDKLAPATQYIPEIISQVSRLMKKKFAYVVPNDGVYFDISKFPSYGKLSHQDVKNLKAGARVKVHEGKRNEGDFVLWKFSKPGEPIWTAPFAKGRPGWHIEDTAITEKELGKSYDLHGGGLDLIFPHHESEIAQMEAITGKSPFVKYWLHNGFVLINNEKMSKSLKNFWTIRDVLKKHSPRAVRYYCLSVHYRSPINYSDEALQHAENAVQRLDDFVLRLQSANGKQTNISKIVKDAEKKFVHAMENDVDTSSALASIFDLMKQLNKLINLGKFSKKNAKDTIKLLTAINQVLGVFEFTKENVSSKVESLINQREQARMKKDFATADMIRKQLLDQGIILEDTKDGVRWKKA